MFAWHDFLALADDLAKVQNNTGYDEAQLRSAVSRAYYAALNITKDHLAKSGNTFTNDSTTHSQVIGIFVKKFRETSDGNFKKIERWIRDLRDDRNCADYDLPLPGRMDITATAKKALLQAGKIILAVGSLPATALQP